MKKTIKINTLLILCLLTFFVGMNKVSARDYALSCYYKLPFPGIDGNGNVISPDSFGCEYGTTTDCSIVASVPANKNHYQCDGKGSGDINVRSYSWYSVISSWDQPFSSPRAADEFTNNPSLKNSSKALPLYGVKSGTVEGGPDGLFVTTSSKECPKYLVVSNGSDSNNKKFITNLLNSKSENCNSFFACNYKFNILSLDDYFNPGGNYEPPAKIVYNSCFVKDVSKMPFEARSYTATNNDANYTNFLKGFEESDSKYTHLVVPLYNATDNDGNIVYEGEKDDSTEDFKRIQNSLVTFRQQVGGSWVKKLESYDEKLKKSCGNDWNEFINIKNYKSAGLSVSKNFVSYGQGSYSSGSLKGYDKDKKISSACWDDRAKFFKDFESFGIFMYTIGANTDSHATDDEQYYRTFTCSLSKEESAANNWLKMEWHFKSVKNGVDSTLENYKSDNERVQTKADAEKAVETCNAELQALKDKNASQAEIDAKQKECDDLSTKNDNLANSNVFRFKLAEVPDFDISNIKYEPSCSDVKQLTYVWNAVTLAVPFLIIIYGIFDYFKAVIGANEDAIRKAKKNFPKRLIAFILFFIMPFLVKVILENLGTKRANNVTYIRCILTRNTGDSESTKGKNNAPKYNQGTSKNNKSSNSSNNNNSKKKTNP